MPVDQFDPDRPNEVQGDVTSVLLIDKVGAVPPNERNLVVDPRTGFDIEVKWEVTGPDAALWLNGGVGNWNVQAYAESIGGGFEGLIARDDSVPPDPNNPPFEFRVTLTVPPNSPLLEEHTAGADTGGLYKLAVAVFLNSNLPGSFDMIGFREGPIFQVEDMR